MLRTRSVKKGLWISETMRNHTLACRVRRLLATRLRWYPSWSTTAWTRATSLGSTLALPLSTRDTVAVETPAAVATSEMVLTPQIPDGIVLFLQPLDPHAPHHYTARSRSVRLLPKPDSIFASSP